MMGYAGRLAAVAFTLIGVAIMRTYAYIYLDYSLAAPPLIGVLFAAVAYFGGLQYDRARFCAEKDCLTLCHNRRFASRCFPELLAKVRRKKLRLSLAVLDCDGFKSINDEHGHKMGDRVLQEIAANIRAHLRKGDLLIRWGGDEFVIITPDAGKDELQKIVERLEQALTELSQMLKMRIR